VDSLGDALAVAQDLTTALCGGFSALYTTYRLGWRGDMPFLSPLPWLLVRSLPFLGTLFVSLLVLRALNHRSERKE
jgi:hypothetical protein